MSTNPVRPPSIITLRRDHDQPTIYLKPTGKGGTGSTAYPLAIDNLLEIWEDIPDNVVLLPGVYNIPFELPPKSISGSGREFTRIVPQQNPSQTKWARGVIRGVSNGHVIKDLTVVGPDVGPSCNGISVTGKGTRIERCGVDHLWGNRYDGTYRESFGIIPYGEDHEVIQCVVDNIASTYASGICPVGWRHKIIGNRVIGNGSGGRNSAFSFYNRDGLYLHNYGTSVNFWIYGDIGGHTQEMLDMDWLNIKLVGNWGDASEAAVRIQSVRNISKGIRAQHYGQMVIENNEWTSPDSVSIFQNDTSTGSSIPYHEAEHFAFDFRNNTFHGEGRFLLDTVPGCIASGNKFDIQPTKHPTHALPIRWHADNSHPAPI